MRKQLDDSNPCIALVEDEQQMRRFLHAALKAEGMRVYESATGKQALIEIRVCQPDMVILDLGLPDMDGVQVIRQLRAWSSIPVLVLSGRYDEMQKVEALDAGADDYLTKPFGVPELLARIRVILRRHKAETGNNSDSVFSFGDVKVDFVHRRIIRKDENVHLTPIEYELLLALIRNEGMVITYSQLLRSVWGKKHAADVHYLRIYMGHLRRKLEENPAQPVHFCTETGIGYRLVC